MGELHDCRGGRFGGAYRTYLRCRLYHLEKVLIYPSLPGRAGESIAQLCSVLIIATACLIPNQSLTWLGWELLFLSVAQWLVWSALQFRYVSRHRTEPWHWMGVRITLNHLSCVPVMVAGISLLVHAGGGLYWLVPGILFSFVAGVFHAWVLLVEILR